MILAYGIFQGRDGMMTPLRSPDQYVTSKLRARGFQGNLNYETNNIRLQIDQPNESDDAPVDNDFYSSFSVTEYESIRT